MSANRKSTRSTHQQQVAETPRLLTLAEVIKRTSMSRSVIYAQMKAGVFPARVRVGARSVRWIEAEVHEFIRSRPRG